MRPEDFSGGAGGTTGKHRRSSSYPLTPAVLPGKSAVSDSTRSVQETSESGTGPTILSAAPMVSAPNGPAVTNMPTDVPTAAALSLSDIISASVIAARQAGHVLTARELCAIIVRARYPHYQPSNDFELQALGMTNYSQVQPEQLSTYLARDWKRFLELEGVEPDVAMASVSKYLDRPADVTGVSDSLQHMLLPCRSPYIPHCRRSHFPGTRRCR